jgi:hypothetical protein
MNINLAYNLLNFVFETSNAISCYHVNLELYVFNQNFRAGVLGTPV